MGVNIFVNWLGQQLERRGWSYQDLADRAGFSRSGVSLVMTQRQGPGLDFCKGVARAFHLPPEYVLRKAGLLPPSTEDMADPSLGEWIEFGANLSPKERLEAIEYAKWRFTQDRFRPLESEEDDEQPSSNPAIATSS
jgi:transcriptional regulator with XRE-family HTH domain